MTKPENYSEPYRLDAESLVPGKVTEGNALPWHADFIACADDGLGWWPAQRPDEVYLDVASAEAGTRQRPWADGLTPSLPEGGMQLVKHWAELGVVAETPGSDGQPVFVETERLMKRPED